MLSIVCLLIVGIIGYAVYWAFFDLERLPKGEFLTEQTSSDGKYTVKAYVSKGSAISADAVRGELVFNEQHNKTRNIYWNYREETATITWIDENTVIINGHELDVPKDKFDFRNQ